MTIYSDVLPKTDEEEDEDDIEAHEASNQRLKVSIHPDIPDQVTCLTIADYCIGSRRSDAEDDEGRVPALLRLSAGILHVSQG